MPNSETKTELERLLERLRDPLQLRVLITVVVLVTGYAAIYLPLSDRIAQTSRKLSEERKRQDLANEVDCLRTQVARFEARLPEKTDTNEWVQYVLEGIRESSLQLKTLGSEDPQRVGPYEAVVLRVELQGGYRDLDSFLHWLETNQRLFRVDSTKIAPGRGKNDGLVMQLTLLGIKG